MLEVRLGGDAAPPGEHGAQHQHVQLGLVVADEDGGADGAEHVGRVVDAEGYAGGEAHHVVERAGGGPLCDALLAEEGEDDGGEDAEEGADEEGDVGGEGAGDEAGFGDGEGECVEEGGEGGVAGEEFDEDVGDGHGGGLLRGKCVCVCGRFDERWRVLVYWDSIVWEVLAGREVM